MTKEKVIPSHKDILGQPIEVGDCVCYCLYNQMGVGVVEKLNPKMVKVKRVGSSYSSSSNKYSTDLVKVHGAEVTMYLLKNNKSR